MLDLLLQAAAQPSVTSAAAAAGLVFEALPAFDCSQLVGADAADAAARWTAAVKTEADAEDQMFDLFFSEMLALPATPTAEAATPTAAGDIFLVDDMDDVRLFDEAGGADDLLLNLLLDDGECPADVINGDAESSSSSPSSFEPTSPAASSSSSPRRPSLSTSTSSLSVVAGGRVTKKKEANREAAYRYRLKQRLDDSAQDQRRAEMQSGVDRLAQRVSGAEQEAQFLMQMCRQIFSSRRQLLLSGGAGRLAQA